MHTATCPVQTIMAEKVKVIAEERVSKSRRGWGGQ
jgi:hypothetical protein